MYILDDYSHRLQSYVVLRQIHKSAVGVVGAVRILGYVVAATFFVVGYADETQAVVVGGASCLESLLSLLLCARTFVGQFSHTTLKGEAGFGDIALPAHRMA